MKDKRQKSKSRGNNPGKANARCKAISSKSGKRCRNPALDGTDYCYVHGEHTARSGPNRPDSGQKSRETTRDMAKRGKGAQTGNHNAIKHGAYSIALLPEEQDIYERKRDQFTAQLGTIDIFDQQVTHMLALIAAKLDVAATKGAPAEALIPISNEILKLLRSLKETRDSRDDSLDDLPKTAADFLLELIAQDKSCAALDREKDLHARLFDLECEVNDLRSRLKIEPREDIAHKITNCSHCRKDGRHRKTAAGLWVCMRCGHVSDAVDVKIIETVRTGEKPENDSERATEMLQKKE